MSDEQLEQICKKLEGILTYLALKEPRKQGIQILKNAGLKRNAIVKMLGPAPSTLRVRKLRRKND